MSSDASADEICRRMAELRRELECDVREVGRSARVMTDWTFYVRQFPWAVVGIAVAAGYMVVPKRKEIITPDRDMLAEMVRKKELSVEPFPRQKEKQGMMRALLVTGITWAARTGITYLGQRLSESAMQKAPQGTSGSPSPQPTPSPVHQPWKK